MPTIPDDVKAAAQASQRKWGCYASVCCAQWALESAFGAHMSGRNNPFGIKARDGQPGTAVSTHEVIGGRSVPMVQRFADYASLDDAFDAHGKLLATGSAYALARTFVGKKDAEGYARGLTGHYATDPQYGAKLIAIMRAHGLYALDGLSAAPAVASPGRVVPAQPVARPGFWSRFFAALIGKAA